MTKLACRTSGSANVGVVPWALILAFNSNPMERERNAVNSRQRKGWSPWVHMLLMVVAFVLGMAILITFHAPPLVTGFGVAVPIGIWAFVAALRSGLRARRVIAQQEAHEGTHEQPSGPAEGQAPN